MNGKISFRDFLNEQLSKGSRIFFDGGMGTMIQKYSGLSYRIPEDLNFYKPDVIKEIYRGYINAGSNVLTANTFGANPVKLKDENSAHTAEEYIEQGIKLLKETIAEYEKENPDDKTVHFAGWDSGQIGKLLEPMGSLTFDEAYESYKTAAVAAEKAGADLAIIETMSDLYEVKAAVLAIQENTSLPVAASMTFQPNMRTLTGADVLTCVTYLESLHADIIGFNCGGSLSEDEELCRQFLKYSHTPVLVQPNAGLPESVNGKDVFKVLPEEFSASQVKNAEEGAMILGGCCGTTPDHIKRMIELTASVPLKKERHAAWNNTYICSYNSALQAGKDAGPKIIGEYDELVKVKEFLANAIQERLDELEGKK